MPTIFGLGEDGDRKTATIMEYHDSIFYALCEGEPVLSTRMGAIDKDEVFAALDLIVPGVAARVWRENTRRLLNAGTERIPYLLAAETMVLGKLLSVPDKYGAIGTPNKLPTQYRAVGASDALPAYAVDFYDQLLADAQKHFPGAHPSVL